MIPTHGEQKYFLGLKTFPIKTDEKSKRASCVDRKYTLHWCLHGQERWREDLWPWLRTHIHQYQHFYPCSGRLRCSDRDHQALDTCAPSGSHFIDTCIDTCTSNLPTANGWNPQGVPILGALWTVGVCARVPPAHQCCSVL